MDFVQVILVFLVTFIAAIDQFSFLESLYQPIVMGPVIGAIMGDLQTGLIVGGTYQLMTIGNMPVGGAQPPNAVIGGIMATVFAISLGIEPNAAVGLAVPFALLGQYAVTIVFTISSPLMAKADQCAKDANTAGINKINYMTMGMIGTLFGLITVAFFIAGDSVGKAMADNIPAWLMGGLGAAGGMMRYIGFATLLRVMISKESWGFYFAGFALASLMAAAGLANQALILIAFIGFAVAYSDYQIQTRISSQTIVEGGDEDGI